MQRYKIITIFFFLLSAASSQVKAEIDDACWTSPTMKIVADLKLANLSSNKAGATGQVAYSMLSSSFSAICNHRTSRIYHEMTHYIDLGPGLLPSTLNSGWYRLSDDVDIKISTPNYGVNLFLPLEPKNQLRGTVTPPYNCNECLVSGFSIASSGDIYLKLRRNVIGGAIVFPRDEKLFTAYRVGNYTPYPVKPGQPIMELYTSPTGTVIPIPTVCEINGGNAINVDFGVVPENRIGISVEQELEPKSINLGVSCNTNLTQWARVRLVADKASFSGELIRSSNSNLGIAMRHNGNVIAPFETFPFWLQYGKASEPITLSLVRNGSATLQTGKFTASATLVIESP
ncbi:fimbrial protein [Serratia marcescens]|uniref:fimbrial protein n=1 Tax=Serratia marcescens TaxID=615 RepID=UPI0034D3A5C5